MSNQSCPIFGKTAYPSRIQKLTQVFLVLLTPSVFFCFSTCFDKNLGKELFRFLSFWKKKILSNSLFCALCNKTIYQLRPLSVECIHFNVWKSCCSLFWWCRCCCCFVSLMLLLLFSLFVAIKQIKNRLLLDLNHNLFLVPFLPIVRSNKSYYIFILLSSHSQVCFMTFSSVGPFKSYFSLNQPSSKSFKATTRRCRPDLVLMVIVRKRKTCVYVSLSVFVCLLSKEIER